MRNRKSKYWTRFLITLEGFYTLHGKWPSVIHLYPFLKSELQEKLSKEDFKKLQSKILLKPDEDNPFLALDEEGNRYDYARTGLPEDRASVNAMEWLNIKSPRYYD